MKLRVNVMFLRLYWQHRQHARAEIDELMHILLILFKSQPADKAAKTTFRSCLSTSRGTFIAFTYDDLMKDELIEVSDNDKQMIIDHVILISNDEEIRRKFRKKKLELELKI